MAKLRDKDDGCPWDQAQTSDSISNYAIEEAYELLVAIQNNDEENIKEELGDLLLQIIFHSQIAEESGRFTFQDIIDGLSSKLIRRHPNVFDDKKIKLSSAVEQSKIWEEIKEKEKVSHQDEKDQFVSISNSLPTIKRSKEIQNIAANNKFDWENSCQVIEKIREEILELEEAMEHNKGIKGELGDLLFSIINLSRHLEMDLDVALEKANQKFMKRFNAMVANFKKEGLNISTSNAKKLNEMWEQVKENEEGL